MVGDAHVFWFYALWRTDCLYQPQGTFLQLAVELDGAMKAYERAFAAMEAEGSPAPTDALIKMAYAYLDKEDKEKVS